MSTTPQSSEFSSYNIATDRLGAAPVRIAIPGGPTPITVAARASSAWPHLEGRLRFGVLNRLESLGVYP